MKGSNASVRRAYAPAWRPKGFTLIELMIVVAVVAILAAIAFPSYNDSVRKSRRGQAKADMVEYAQIAERFHTINNTYKDFDLVPGAPLPTQSPREAGATARYRLVYTTTQSTFVITATALNDQTKDDCGNLGINQAGGKTNSKGTLSKCW